MSESNELLPCPFCGGKDLSPSYSGQPSTEWHLICRTCGASGPLHYDASPAGGKGPNGSLAETWNRRGGAPVAQGEHEETLRITELLRDEEWHEMSHDEQDARRREAAHFIESCHSANVLLLKGKAALAQPQQTAKETAARTPPASPQFDTARDPHKGGATLAGNKRTEEDSVKPSSRVEQCVAAATTLSAEEIDDLCKRIWSLEEYGGQELDQLCALAKRGLGAEPVMTIEVINDKGGVKFDLPDLPIGKYELYAKEPTK
jgi:Lar family restriction alleviation protein